MKVAVLGGSGQVGRVAVRSLLDSGIEVVVADRQPPVDASAFLEFRAIDASVERDVRTAIEGVDAVMSFVGPYYRFGTSIAATVIDAGLPLIDVCDDADVTVELLGLHDRAVAAGVPLVTGAGGSPGVLNMAARIAAAGFTHIDQLLTAWVLEPRAEGSIATVAHTVHCIADPYPTWRDGGLATMRATDDPAPITFSFPAPVGDVQVRNMGHPEPVTLGRVIEADEIRVLGGIIPEIAFEAIFAFVRLGMASTDPITVAGHDRPIAPRDVLVAHMANMGDAGPYEPESEKIGLAVRVTGTTATGPTTRHLAFANHGTLADSTALPAVAGLGLVLDGQVPPGAHGPEVFDPAAWLGALDRLHPTLFHRFQLADGDADPRVLTNQELAAHWQDLRTLQPSD